MMEHFIYEIIPTVISGLILTFILFLFKDIILPKKNITGEWKTIVRIKKSKYKPYQNIGIEFKIHLLQKGNEIIGSGEKMKDFNTDGTETVFNIDKRVKVEISGYYEKKYLKRSKVFLNILEFGKLRESRTTYFLVVKSSKYLKGDSISTAAESKGIIEMIKQ